MQLVSPPQMVVFDGPSLYSCVKLSRKPATHAPVHVIIAETGYFVPSSIRDEQQKATAVVAAFETFAADPFVDGVNYANVDECDSYPSGYFVGGCLIDSLGTRLPAYAALAHLAARAYQ